MSASHPPPRGTETQAVTRRLIWLFVFRAVVMAVLLGFSILAAIGEPEVLSSAPQVYIYIAAGLAFFVILVGAIWQRRLRERWLAAQIAFQQAGDLLVATLLVFASGGVESAFVFWFSLTTINGAALSYRKGAFVSAIGGALGLAALAVLAFFGIGPGHDLAPLGLAAAVRFFLFNISALFVIALLASYLTEQLRQAGEKLEATQDDLSRLESLHAAVLSSLTSGLMVVDAQQRLSFLNRSGASLLGVALDEVRGTALSSFAPALAASPQDLSGGRAELTIEVEGAPRVFGFSSSPLLYAEKETGGQVITFQDLTDLRSLEVAMARSERLASLGRFAAGLAHELRNPLASLSGCVELLSRDAQAGADDAARQIPKDEKTKLFAIVLRESERLNQLLTDFLRYARPTKPQHISLDFSRLVEDLVAVARREPQAPDYVLELTEPAMVFGDVDQLKQLVWNLLSNASQAAGENGQVRICLKNATTAKGKGSGLMTLCVEDNGPGIPKELLDKVLEPFFTTRSTGTGLGLPTVLRIVEAHGGELRFAVSDLGGAKVEVDFPSIDNRP